MEASKRKVVAVALVVILVAAAASVVLLSGALKQTQGATILDASGTSVAVNQTPERIVSCSPAITEMVFALGLGDKVVAVTQFDDYPAKAKELADAKTIVGGFSNPSYEAILNYTPDLVLLEAGAPGHDDLAQQLREAGQSVVVLYAQEDLETVYDCIDLLGNVTGTQTVAKTLIEGMKSDVSSIVEKAGSANDSTDVMFVIFIGEANLNSPYVAGSNTAIDQVIKLAGGNNAFEVVDGFDMPSEEILTANAASVDYIFLTVMNSAWDMDELLDWLNSNSLWKNSPAVKNNNVYFLTGQAESIFNRQSVRMVDAVALMAEILHPDAFDGSVPHSDDQVNLLGDEYEDYLVGETSSETASVAVMAAASKD